MLLLDRVDASVDNGQTLSTGFIGSSGFRSKFANRADRTRGRRSDLRHLQRGAKYRTFNRICGNLLTCEDSVTATASGPTDFPIGITENKNTERRDESTATRDTAMKDTVPQGESNF